MNRAGSQGNGPCWAAAAPPRLAVNWAFDAAVVISTVTSLIAPVEPRFACVMSRLSPRSSRRRCSIRRSPGCRLAVLALVARSLGDAVDGFQRGVELVSGWPQSGPALSVPLLAGVADQPLNVLQQGADLGQGRCRRWRSTCWPPRLLSMAALVRTISLPRLSLGQSNPRRSSLPELILRPVLNG